MLKNRNGQLIQLTKQLNAVFLAVKGKPKGDAKGLVLHALTEHNLLKGTVRPKEMSEMEFQPQMKKLEMLNTQSEK